MANQNTRSTDIGLFIIRLGLGTIFLMMGWGKLSGGIEKWTSLGKAMSVYGISFYPAFWGFMAAFSEFFGGLALVLGAVFRPMMFLLAFTMLTAAVMLISKGTDMTRYSHAVNLTIVFSGLLISGSGSFSVGRKISLLKDKWYQ